MKQSAIKTPAINDQAPTSDGMEASAPPKGGEMDAVARNAKVSLNLKGEKLSYILEMLNELRQLSTTIDEPMVAYLIEMAVLETSTAIHVMDLGVEAVDRERRGL